MPKGLRKSLYFKDDDSRLSFLFGNYITLTNIFVRENKTDKITVSADDLAGFDNESYVAEYYVDGNKTKKINVAKGATVEHGTVLCTIA